MLGCENFDTLFLWILGQNGTANMPNGAAQGVQMNGQMAGKFEEAVMNQFVVNVQGQATPDYQQQVTPEHEQDQDDRRLQHYWVTPLHALFISFLKPKLYSLVVLEIS